LKRQKILNVRISKLLPFTNKQKNCLSKKNMLAYFHTIKALRRGEFVFIAKRVYFQ